jgi:hypothetical protein
LAVKVYGLALENVPDDRMPLVERLGEPRKHDAGEGAVKVESCLMPRRQNRQVPLIGNRDIVTGS